MPRGDLSADAVVGGAFAAPAVDRLGRWLRRARVKARIEQVTGLILATVAVLLIRGPPELDVVDGIPDEYLKATDRCDPDLGQADRLRNDSAERGRGTHPTTRRASACLRSTPTGRSLM
jgi:hypothetical protein